MLLTCARLSFSSFSSLTHSLMFLSLLIVGICLPRNILDLFPENSQSGVTYVSRYLQEMETLELNNNLSISSVLAMRSQYQTEGDAVTDVATIESAVSSMSDLSTGNKRMRKRPVVTGISFSMDQVGGGAETSEIPAMIRSTSSNTGGGGGGGVAGGVSIARHNRSECILCCRNKVIGKLADTSLNIQETRENLTSMNGKIRDSDVSFYSPESIVSDDSANTNMPDRISNVILRNCMKMANPILFKNCRKILMELKQKYPQSFQDLCLYSEVCKYMSSCSYRMTVRRFIQEIFLDLNYDQLYNTNDIDLILKVARQRYADLKLLDSSKSFPTSPPSSSSVASSSTTSTVQYSQAIIQQQHKIHSLKSPLLASVYETSIENLIDSPPLRIEESKVAAAIALDEVDSRSSPEKKAVASPTSSEYQVKAEIHNYRHSIIDSSSTVTISGDNNLQPIRRRRFNTLELDLSCTKNKFPIKHRSQASSSTSTDGPSATSTLQRQRHVSTSANTPQSLEMHDRKMSSSSLSPLSPPALQLGPLYCEQRLLQSRSEANMLTLSSSSASNVDSKFIIMRKTERKDNFTNDEESR